MENPLLYTKICKIKIENDKVLGNLELDFELENKKIARKIIFSGDNGVGKTRLLKFLSMDLKFLSSIKNQNPNNFFIVCKLIENKNEKFYYYQNGDIEFSLVAEGIDGFSIDKDKIIEFDNKKFSNIIDVNLTPGSFSVYFNCSENNHILGKEINNETNSLIKGIYNKAEKQTIEYINDLINNRDITNIGKSYRMKNIKKENIMTSWVDFLLSFNNIFSMNELMIKGWDVKNDKIKMTKYNKDYDVTNASSGEKQIIWLFTAIITYAVFNQRIMFFDEIELYLHPSWQLKLLKEIQNLIGNKSQIFMSTHSPFIQSSIDRETDLFYFISRNSIGKIISKKNRYYGADEINQLNFLNNLNKNIINIVVSGKYDKYYLEEMIRLYGDEIWQEKNFKFYLPNETIEVNGDGDSVQFSFHQKLLELVKNNDFSIYFLYDHDFKPEEKQIKDVFDKLLKTLL